MQQKELIEKLKIIKNMGFVKTHRKNDTGIGKTLEDLLEIQENNIALPDVGDIELKAKRIASNSMLTLATKEPQPKGIMRTIFDNFKYKDEHGKDNLHTTIYGSKFNPQGFKISVNHDKLVIENTKKISAYWPLSIFDDVLKSKSNKILLVFAQTKGEKNTDKESFHYTEAFLLSNLNFNKFVKAIENDKLKVDIRIGVYRTGAKEGQFHNHGTGFRIKIEDFFHIYDKYEQLI